ncbi:MAG: hypothetical protein AABW91_04250 [Nanoarchaeota archaeon]
MNIQTEQSQTIPEFKLYRNKFRDLVNESEHPYTQEKVLWKLVADDLYLEAESINGKDKERKALLYHQVAHIYTAVSEFELANKSYKRLTDKSLELPISNN